MDEEVLLCKPGLEIGTPLKERYAKQTNTHAGDRIRFLVQPQG